MRILSHSVCGYIENQEWGRCGCELAPFRKGGGDTAVQHAAKGFIAIQIEHSHRLNACNLFPNFNAQATESQSRRLSLPAELRAPAYLNSNTNYSLVMSEWNLL